MTKETELRIPACDGKNIYGILRGNPREPLIVLVHGLFGNMNEAMHYEAARYFEQYGFSTFRFNLYGPHQDARKLRDCTLELHGKDIDSVIEHFTGLGTKHFYVIGHSYGFPSLLSAKNIVHAQALASWDGTFLPLPESPELPKSSDPPGYILNFGFDIIVPTEMVEESHAFSTKSIFSDNSELPRTLFVASEKGRNSPHKESAEKMMGAGKMFRRLVIIKNARHNYTEEGAMEELFYETADWFL